MRTASPGTEPVTGHDTYPMGVSSSSVAPTSRSRFADTASSSGGIESVLANHPDVNNAVVVVHRGAGHELAAAVTVNGAVDEPTLLNWLRERLPAYEVPAVVLVLPTLPLTRNGKVDRAAVTTLTRGLSATSTENDAPPEGPYEEYVAALWEEFLSVPVTSRAASFFELGGDSLTATRMATRIRSEEGADLPPARPLPRPDSGRHRACPGEVGPRPALIHHARRRVRGG